MKNNLVRVSAVRFSVFAICFLLAASIFLLVAPSGGASLDNNVTTHFQDTYDYPPFTGSENFFTIVVWSDTQHYTYKENALGQWENMADWVLANKDEWNIEFVIHEGDIIQTHPGGLFGNEWQPSEWEKAKYVMTKLDNKIPYGWGAGNHDVVKDNRDTILDEYFPPEKYRQFDYWGGDFWKNKSNYQLFSACGMDFIVLNIEWGAGLKENEEELVYPEYDVLKWAASVLDNYPSRWGIMNTHFYIDEEGRIHGLKETPEPTIWPILERPGEETCLSGGTQMEEVLVIPYNNIRIITCGHIQPGMVEEVRKDEYGKRSVYTLLFNTQSIDDTGGSWMRLMTFAPEEDRIYVRTLKTLEDSFQADEDSQFIINIELGPPPPQTGLSALAVSENRINLDWDDNPDSFLDHYNVHRGQSPGFPIEVGNLIGSPSSSEFSDTGLSESTTYYYKVTAVDTAGNESSASSVASDTTLASPSEGEGLLTALIVAIIIVVIAIGAVVLYRR